MTTVAAFVTFLPGLTSLSVYYPYSHEDVAGQSGQQREGDDEEHGLVVSWGAVVLMWDRSGLVGRLVHNAIAGRVLLQEEDVVRSLPMIIYVIIKPAFIMSFLPCLSSLLPR